MLDTLYIRLIIAAAFFALTLFFGLLPLYISKQVNKRKESEQNILNDGQVECGRQSRWQSVFMCFGAGVLFATCFLHLIPEVGEAFEKANQKSAKPGTDKPAENENGHTFPLDKLIICVGFFLVYFIEEIVHYFIDKQEAKHESERKLLASIERRQQIQQQQQQQQQNLPQNHSHNHSHHDQQQQQSRPIQSDSVAPSTNVIITPRTNSGKYGAIEDDYGADYQQKQLTLKNESNQTNLLPENEADIVIVDENAACTNKHYQHNHAHSHSHLHHHYHNNDIEEVLILNEEPFVINSTILIVALSFHSIFEGMAIGVQDTITHLWQLAVAVGCHKFLIAFIIGLELLNEGKSTRQTVINVLIFSLVTPIGILFAVIAKTKGDLLVNAVLTSLATGTLLYVIFVEILPKERLSKVSGVLQFIAMAIGFTAMAGLQYATAAFDND